MNKPKARYRYIWRAGKWEELFVIKTLDVYSGDLPNLKATTKTIKVPYDSPLIGLYKKLDRMLN